MSDIRPEVTERLTTFLYERFGIQAAEALADFGGSARHGATRSTGRRCCHSTAGTRSWTRSKR